MVFWEISSEQISVIVTNLGCHVLSVFAPDRTGKKEDVLLGVKHIEDCFHDPAYMGAIVGRVANRIGGAEFELNGKRYRLAANSGPNHLHGGVVGFDRKLFSYDVTEEGICFRYTSPDGEEGYPGNLTLEVTYSVQEDTFLMRYHAVSDADTLVNITNHMYFNLSGEALEPITEHQLKIAADEIACVNETCLADGRFLKVENSPFDFREYHKIGQRIGEDHEQLKNAGGYDHAFLLKPVKEQVTLWHEKSGRKVILHTDLPTVQLYTGNFLTGGCMGKCGRPYVNREGVALETQKMPNAIHIEKEPSVILRKGECFDARTALRFTVSE